MAASAARKQTMEIGAPFDQCQSVAKHCEIKLHGPFSQVFKYIRRTKRGLVIGNHKKIHTTLEEVYQWISQGVTKRLFYYITMSRSSYILRRNTKNRKKQNHLISTEKHNCAAVVNHSASFSVANNVQTASINSQIIRYNADFCFDIETQYSEYIGHFPTISSNGIDNSVSLPRFTSSSEQFDITKSMEGIDIEPLSLNEKSDEYRTEETGLKTPYDDPVEPELQSPYDDPVEPELLRYLGAQVQSSATEVPQQNTAAVSLGTHLAENSGLCAYPTSHIMAEHIQDTETSVGNNERFMGQPESAWEPCNSHHREEPPSSNSANTDMYDMPAFLIEFQQLHGPLDVKNDEKYDRADKLCDELEPYLARLKDVNSTGIDSSTCNFQIFVNPGTEDYVKSEIRKLPLINPEDFKLIEVIEDDAEVSWLAQIVKDKQEDEHPVKDKVQGINIDMEMEEYDITSGQTANTSSSSTSSEMPAFMDCFLAGTVDKDGKQCFLAGTVDKDGKPCPVSIRPGQSIYPIEAKNAGQIRNDPMPLMHTLGCIMMGETDRCCYGFTVGHSKNFKKWIYYTKCSGDAIAIIGKCREQLYGNFGGTTIDVCALKLYDNLHRFINSSVPIPNRDVIIVGCFDGPHRALKNVPVFMVGARSGYQTGTVVMTKYKTQDPEGKEVRNAIVVKIKADTGDSGTLLLANPRPGAEGKIEVDAVAQIMINRKRRGEIICCPFHITKQYVEQSIGQKLLFR